MYILINKNTNRVNHISDKKFSYFSDNLRLAEVDTLPEKYDYLIAENIREETKIWSEAQEEYDENNELITKEVEKSRTYTSCDLVACFMEVKEPSPEEIMRQKEEQRSKKIVNLIRKKYTLEDELAILRQKDTKTEKYLEYFNYVEECVKNVPKNY